MGKKQLGTKVISFRVSEELYDRLETLAEEERDEAGLPLNAATTARRLMLEALKTKEKATQKK